jgi:hypothetical protein
MSGVIICHDEQDVRALGSRRDGDDQQEETKGAGHRVDSF